MSEILDVIFRCRSIRRFTSEVLGIPENVVPLSMVYKYYDEYKVYWQCYQPCKRRPKIKNVKYIP